MRANLQFSTDLFTLTKEVFNRKLHFLVQWIYCKVVHFEDKTSAINFYWILFPVFCKECIVEMCWFHNFSSYLEEIYDQH